ncbi:MAG: hypothetical protein V1720_15110 [bacterium]
MTIISIDTAKKYHYANLLYELNITKEKLRLLEIKYSSGFGEFEKSIEKRKEEFEVWDDYIEWKSYIQYLEQLNKEKTDFENDNIRVA